LIAIVFGLLVTTIPLRAHGSPGGAAQGHPATRNQCSIIGLMSTCATRRL
jgi:hypothetical protein